MDHGANGEGRTPIPLREPDPKSGASANSATFARLRFYTIISFWRIRRVVNRRSWVRVKMEGMRFSLWPFDGADMMRSVRTSVPMCEPRFVEERIGQPSYNMGTRWQHTMALAVGRSLTVAARSVAARPVADRAIGGRLADRAIGGALGRSLTVAARPIGILRRLVSRRSRQRPAGAWLSALLEPPARAKGR